MIKRGEGWWTCECDQNTICETHEQDLKEIWLKQLREAK
jgi:hypothetical protein